MNSYERIYNLLTEVSIERAGRAAAKARKERVGRTAFRGSEKVDAEGRGEDTGYFDSHVLAPGERYPPKHQIARIKNKFAERAIKKHGEAGTVGGLAGPSAGDPEGQNLPKRTLYSGGRREYRHQTVDRKFEKAAKRASDRGLGSQRGLRRGPRGGILDDELLR